MIFTLLLILFKFKILFKEKIKNNIIRFILKIFFFNFKIISKLINYKNLYI